MKNQYQWFNERLHKNYKNFNVATAVLGILTLIGLVFVKEKQVFVLIPIGLAVIAYWCAYRVRSDDSKLKREYQEKQNREKGGN